MKTLRICLIFWMTAAKTKMEVFRKILKGRNHVAGRLVRPEGSPSVVAALWLILFCFLISIPSSLSVPVKGRESSGIVLLTEKYKQEHRCLVNTLYAEARGEPEEGIRAVMSVIYNRKKHKNYPSTFCGVILQSKQFSAFNQDKGLATRGLKPVRELDKKAYALVAYIANEAVLGRFKPVLEPSVLFYTKTSVRNHWTRRMTVVKIISSHQFYKE